MRIEERNQILELLKNLEKIDFEDRLIEVFDLTPKEIDLRLVVGNYTAAGLTSAIKKIIANFNSEFNKTDWPSLSTYYTQQEIGNRNLMPDLASLNSFLQNSKFDEELYTIVNALSIYQRTNSFWNNKQMTPKEEKEFEKSVYLKIKETALNNVELQLADLLNEINQSKNEFSTYLEEKKVEIQTLESNATLSSENLEKIHRHVDNSEKEYNRILGFASDSKHELEESSSLLVEEKRSFEEYKTSMAAHFKNIDETILKADAKNEQWDDKLKIIEEKEIFFKNKENEINNLTGFAAGVSLFHTFQERKKELNNPVRNWFIGLIVSVILTVSGVVIIFYVTPSLGDWSIFALNTLKSSPFFILLYFAIRQYSKERSIQEEYAFKSAVALTVNAFADKLSPQGTSGKDQLIKDSVTKIYDIPNALKDKGSSMFTFRTKTFNETVKNLTEAVKEIKK